MPNRSVMRSAVKLTKLAAPFLCAIVFVLVSASTGYAVTVTSAADGNWNAGATWVGGKVPAAGDDVIIAPGHDITVTASTHINSISFSPGAARSFTVNAGIILNVTGSAGVVIQNAATATNNTVTVTGTGTISALTLIVGGTEINVTGDADTALISTISNFNIAGGMSVNSEDVGNNENNATLELQSGTISVGGTVTLDEDGNSTALLTMITGAQTGTLSVAGATPFTDIGSPAVDFAGTASTVNYSGASQTIRSTTYTNLTVSGSGTKTLAAITAINADLTIDLGTTLNPAAFTLNLDTATVNVNGTLDFTNATGSLTATGVGASTLIMGANGLIRTTDNIGLGPAANASLIENGGTWTTVSIDTTGTVEYNAIVARPVFDRNYNNLIISNINIKTWTVAATRTVNGNLTINSTAPLTITGANTVNVKGDFTNNGTFTHAGGGTIALNGTSNQTLGGASATTFLTVTIANTGTGDEVVSLTSAALTTVSTALNVNDGVFDMGASSNLTTNTVTIAAAGTFRNFGTGDLTLSGNLANAGAVRFSANGSPCGDADDILIRSTAGTRTWSGVGTFSLSDVDVQSQAAGVPPLTITVQSGTDNNADASWVFVACASNTYTWNGGVLDSWIVAANWTPTRTVPATTDVLIIDGTATPAPTITNVPSEEIAALRLINGASPTLNSGAANNTLTLSGRTGSDLSVPASNLLTLAGANALRINIVSGSTAPIGGQIIFQDAAHRLLGNAASAIVFQSGADFTTTTGFTGNAFGPGGGGGNGNTGSVQFESGSQYFHGAGDSPFGSAASAAVAVFQTGSEADWLANSGFQASGRTYANLVIGNSTTEVDVTDTGSGNFQFNNLVINSTGSATSSLTFEGTGASAVIIKGNITSAGTGAPGNLPDVDLDAGTGGIQIDSGGTITFGNIGNSRGIFFDTDATVVSGTTLNLSRLVQMGLSADGLVTDNGTIVPNFLSVAGYIVGAVRRPVVPASYVFPVGKVTGYTPVTLSSATGGGDMTIRAVALNHPAVDGGTSLNEYWTITLNSGALNTTLEFTYLDADVDGVESEYKVIRIENGTPLYNPTTVLNTSANTATVTEIDHFSDWTLGQAVGASAVTFSRFNAVSFSDGVQLTWESGFEVDNLGYHVYREQNGKRTRVTPSIVAGSALTVGPGNRMTAGYSYSWFDPHGTPDTTYHLEAIDLNGGRQNAGPINPFASSGGQASPRRSRAKLLRDLVQTQRSSNPAQTSTWPAKMGEAGAESLNITSDAISVQQGIAGGKAVKIQVNESAWYRITQPQLVAAGFDASSDARMLQLIVDGQQVPINLSTSGSRLGSGDWLEFYGVPLDTLTTDTRTYWLVAGTTQGSRMVVRRGKVKPDSTDADSNLRSFASTVELREKLMYVSNLLNGDGGNIFGAAIFSDGVDQTIAVTNLDSAGSQVQLEVALQGLTKQDHQVQLKLNGAVLGTMNFTGREHPVETFAISPSLLTEGNNMLSLISQNGDSDISLVDWVRLTYAHRYRATNNALRFTAPGGRTVRIENFSSPNVRVVDVTNPNSPVQHSVFATTADGGYNITVNVQGAGERTLLAFADDQSGHPAAIARNQPSSWNAPNNGADMLIITHSDFRNAIEPLANLRRSQGLVVAVVDVEDVYDEFSYGAHTPDAIKSFLSTAATSWQRKPKYVLLVGDSSWDPRDYFNQGDNDFVPTKLIDTEHLETASDDWLADFSNSGVPELAVGRLPGRTAADITLMVSKISKYELERELNTPLRGAVLVADNGFETRSAQTGGLMPEGVSLTNINRADVGNDDIMRGQIVDALNQGPMLVNYFGHGSVRVWTGEGLLSSDLVSGLTNVDKPSLYVMMTCLNGYASDAFIDSLAESSLKAPNGGAVAVWASSGFTEPPPQFALSSEFYRLLFTGQPVRLGEAARGAKAATSSMDVRRTWILLGDPAMRIR